MGERATIQQLSAEQGSRCAYCGVRLVVPGLDRRGGRTAWKEGQPNTGPRRSYKFRRATFDHVVPKSAGGKDRWDNLVVACLWRNGYRANQPADVAFLKSLAGFGAARTRTSNTKPPAGGRRRTTACDRSPIPRLPSRPPPHV